MPLRTLRSDINPLRDLRYTRAACDISSMRYALSGVKGIYIISQPTAREVISLLSVACMASRENISHLRKQIYRHKKELLCPQKQCLQRKEDEEFYRSSSFSCGR